MDIAAVYGGLRHTLIVVCAACSALQQQLLLTLYPPSLGHLRPMFISAVHRTATSGVVTSPAKRLISVRVIFFIDLAVIQPLDWH